MLQLPKKQRKKMSVTLVRNSQGENPSPSVNKVKRDNLSSRNRTSALGRRHGKNDKQTQPTEVKQRCFRCGLTNYSSDNCKYKDSECFRCHKTSLTCSLSVATRSHRARRRKENNMSVTQIRILKRKCRRAPKMNFSPRFLVWMAYTILSLGTQEFRLLQSKFLYELKMLNFRWKWTPEQPHLSSAMQITNGISNTWH